MGILIRLDFFVILWYNVNEHHPADGVCFFVPCPGLIGQGFLFQLNKGLIL